MNSEKDMSRRDALKTMGAMIATAALSTSGLSACANPKKKVAENAARILEKVRRILERHIHFDD